LVIIWETIQGFDVPLNILKVASHGKASESNSNAISQPEETNNFAMRGTSLILTTAYLHILKSQIINHSTCIKSFVSVRFIIVILQFQVTITMN
jgi:hypothetical protein